MRISDWSSDVCSSDLRRPPVSGDWTAPTQPYSVGMPSFAGERLRERDMWGITPFDQLWCRIRFRQLRYQGPATAPATDESLIYPSIGGGMNWGDRKSTRRNSRQQCAFRMPASARTKKTSKLLQCNNKVHTQVT